MWRRALLSCTILISLTISIYCDNYVFETKVLNDLDRLPTLSNGHIGFVAYSDAVHINGVYNGRKGESHRARIPNYGKIVLFEKCGVFSEGDSCTYSLDIRQGVFRTTSVYDGYSVELVTYAHRYYDKTIVNHVTIKRSVPGTSATYTVRLLNLPGSESVDFDILSENIRTIDGVVTMVVHLRTKTKEHDSYQQNLREVFVYSQAVDEIIQLASNEDERTFTYVTCFGSDKGTIANIEEEYRLILPIRDTILSSHTNEWNTFWTSSGISVEGNDELAKSIHSSLFFLSSALPSLNTSGLFQKPFYGLAPSGLGRGGVVRSEYQGHSFWDTEMWMLPPVLLLEPEWSKAALNYRYQSRIASADIAKGYGYEGWRFPWEGGYTGCETTPDCCPQNPSYQQHTTAGVAYAYRNQFFATHDEEWMKSEGCEMAYRTAEYWASRVAYNSIDKLYEIIGVMGPDEDVWNVTNNPYTNVVAAYNLFFGEYASCYCNQFFPDLYNKSNGWDKIAQAIRLLHDDVLDYTPQYDNFDASADIVIKQADTVLVGYPLMYPLAASTLKNNLYTYGNKTRADGPGMTWAMHSIGLIDVGETPSDEMFYRSYNPYIRRPFYTWQEIIEPVVGVGNFITGAGGLLQLILNGYGGIRLYSDHMAISRTLLPPGTTKLNINGFKYLRGEFSLEQTETTLRLTVKRFGNVNIRIDGVPQSSEKQTIYDLPKTQSIELWPRSSSIFSTCQMNANIINIPNDFVTYNLVSNTDYTYNDITYWEGPFNLCAAACDSTPDCIAYRPDIGTGANCWLKDKLENPLHTPGGQHTYVSSSKYPTRTYNLVSNTDYPYNDITYWRGPFNLCAAACDSTPDCIAYRPDKGTGANCWLKDKLENPYHTPGDQTYVVSSRDPTRTYNLVSNTDYTYNDITYWEGPFNLCAAACDSTPDCIAYRPDIGTGANCWLKDKLENPLHTPGGQHTYVSSSKYPTRTYNLVSNTDYPYNDITYWRGPFNLCAAACDSTPDCIAYRPDKGTGANCWLKDKLENPYHTPGDQTYVISSRDPTRTYNLVSNTDFPYNDITYWRGPFNLCAAACDSTPDCIAYRPDIGTGANCWLKDKLENPLHTPGGQHTYVINSNQ